MIRKGKDVIILPQAKNYPVANSHLLRLIGKDFADRVFLVLEVTPCWKLTSKPPCAHFPQCPGHLILKDKETGEVFDPSCFSFIVDHKYRLFVRVVGEETLDEIVGL